MNVFAERALNMIEQGFTVIPLEGKAPVLKGWQQLRSVTVDQVNTWENSGLWKNIGMVCGEASGNVVVLDFDGLPAYEMFKARFPALVETFTVKTGSGNGMHCYYRVDLLPDNVDVKDIPAGDELVNIELKSNGRQVVIPPSIHPLTHSAYAVEKRLPIRKLSDLSEVIAWMRGLQPDWQPPQMSLPQRSTDLNPKLLDAVERHFTSLPHKTHGAWINTTCPNARAHKNGDHLASFGYNAEHACGHCFRCGVMNLRALLPLIGIEAKDYGGFYERKESPPQMPSNGGMGHTFDVRPASPNGVQPPTDVLKVVTRSSALTAFWNSISDYDTPIENAPIVSPFKVLHRFGGMARVSRRGKMMGVVGISGGGKTSLLESAVDGYLDNNVSCLVWSPEWEPDEFVERSVQRYGGAKMEDVYLHKVYIDEMQRGIKNGQGKELSKDQFNASNSALRMLRKWESEVGYVDCPDLNIDRLKTALGNTLRSIDFTPGVLVIDYVQLLYGMEKNADLTMYNMLVQLKALCKSYHLLGLIATQVTKDGARGQKSGQMLDGLAARFVNDDTFNLFVTINPDWDESGKLENSAVLNVTKNSFGQRGKVRIPVDWEHLLFDDALHPNQMFGEDA